MGSILGTLCLQRNYRSSGELMRRAAKVDANQNDIVLALRKIGCTVQPLHAVGAGCPDLLACLGSRVVLLEVKDGAKPPSERALTPDQVRWHRKWTGPLYVVETVEDAIRAMQEAA